MSSNGGIGDEQRKHRKREREEQRKLRKHVKARAKLLRKVGVFGFLIALVVGGSYFVIATLNSMLGIGPLNSAHDHIDFSIYVNGEALKLSNHAYQVRSSYVHLEGNDGS